MTSNTLVIVADKFAEFTSSKRAVTLSQMLTMLELPEQVLPGPIRLFAGQGVPDSDIADLVRRIDAFDPTGKRWDAADLRTLPDRAEPALSHKKNPCNTLIGVPVRAADDTFHVDICIDEKCELMGDHQTGQHVQGMLLVEAGRQAFLAVTEKFFMDGVNEKTYFVIKSITTEFLGFVFPLPAHIEYRVLTKDINERRRKFEVEMLLYQGGEARTRIGCAFTVFPHQVISEREAALAISATQFALQGPSDGAKPARVA
ncbi:AfsA-related hotdog domain-containing protein [Notoacmeibacter marinus]|uniref:AfsA-related hotdog domain-containing protein n=1 Tax=Notoacmeibacter marinus TaxID=1876515 RepID=UPI000DF2D97D|nr:AfsA-related hotdog domain-containing protein [Notoacmeibacter marinus]